MAPLAALLVGSLQQGIQLLYKARALGADEALDLLVDGVAGGLGAVMSSWRGRVTGAE